MGTVVLPGGRVYDFDISDRVLGSIHDDQGLNGSEISLSRG